jgi:hypothetical protein
VYATEPSVLLGRIFMEEMADFLDRSPKPRRTARWKTVLRLLPPPLGDLKVKKYGKKELSGLILHWTQLCTVYALIWKALVRPVSCILEECLAG